MRGGNEPGIGCVVVCDWAVGHDDFGLEVCLHVVNTLGNMRCDRQCFQVLNRGL